MKIKNLLIPIILISSIQANECSNIIALSKVTSSTIENKSSLEQHASNFCKEYSKSSGSTKSANYELSYKFLSLSMGSNKANTNSVASKYCSASNSTESRNDAYKQYIETISPNAYSAYTSCLAMSKKNLKFKLDMAALLADDFSLYVNFSSDIRDETATLKFYAPKGVKCSWHELNSSKIIMPSGSSALLNCSRSNILTRTYVKVFRENARGSQLTIPWQGYDKNGIPLNILSELEKKYDKVLSDNQTLLTSLENSVTAFNSDTCPVGWKPYEKAYGRFIRGLDKLGKIDPNRKIGTLQEDSFKAHNHNNGSWNMLSRYDGGNTVHANTDNSGGELNIRRGGVIKARGDKETRPKNVALLYCIKK